MSPLERYSELTARFTGAVAEWDDHIASCRDCLRVGSQLCIDGMYLSTDVVGARSVLEAFETRMSLRERAVAIPESVMAEVAA